ncbi:MAG: Ppx/GppA family phosphatase [Synergistaceae bacterium]|jgi:exopolyphosphatase/guanosine-5'-triphosphate,3'-diphosphate pyrophosphatase|nr:Ppx/GppA family phosphatase [Synergistaceae bacterium]
MPVKAVLDVGTNSIKLLVMERTDEETRILSDWNIVARLGEGYEASGVLDTDAMERTAAAIEEMSREARSLGADEIAAVGTQAMRRARNAPLFIRDVEARCGVSIRAISGDEEAELSYMAASDSLECEGRTVLVFDVGGGSSEIVRGLGADIEQRCSLPVGALSLHRMFFGGDGPAAPDSLSRAGSYARTIIGESGTVAEMRTSLPADGLLCAGTGGTITTLAAVKLGLGAYVPEEISGSTLDKGEIQRQIDLYSSMSVPERARIPGLNPSRADIILPGACIVRELLGFFRSERLTVSDRGLRFGVMKKRFGISPSQLPKPA